MRNASTYITNKEYLKPTLYEIENNSVDSPGEAFIGVQSTSRELVFEDVVIEYWSETLEFDFVVMQPVYRFMGTSITSNGEQESFSITVQANVVNAE